MPLVSSSPAGPCFLTAVPALTHSLWDDVDRGSHCGINSLRVDSYNAINIPIAWSKPVKIKRFGSHWLCLLSYSGCQRWWKMYYIDQIKALSGDNIWGRPCEQLPKERMSGWANGPSGRSLPVVICTSVSCKSKAYIQLTQVQEVWFIRETNASYSRKYGNITIDWGSWWMIELGLSRVAIPRHVRREANLHWEYDGCWSFGSITAFTLYSNPVGIKLFSYPRWGNSGSENLSSQITHVALAEQEFKPKSAWLSHCKTLCLEDVENVNVMQRNGSFLSEN